MSKFGGKWGKAQALSSMRDARCPRTRGRAADLSRLGEPGEGGGENSPNLSERVAWGGGQLREARSQCPLRREQCPDFGVPILSPRVVCVAEGDPAKWEPRLMVNLSRGRKHTSSSLDPRLEKRVPSQRQGGWAWGQAGNPRPAWRRGRCPCRTRENSPRRSLAHLADPEKHPAENGGMKGPKHSAPPPRLETQAHSGWRGLLRIRAVVP